MPSVLTKLFIVGVALAAGLAVLAAPADAAKARKHHKQAVARTHIQAKPGYWGTNLVPAGPLYFGQVYLGDDPDPNIRAYILRDLSGRFGGSE